MHRLFVAIRPPQAIRDCLLDAMEGADLKWQDEEQLHLTLRFIGEVERPLANDIASALSDLSFPSFELAIHGVGRFDHGRRGALWAGVKSKEELRALAAKVERACQSAGLVPERRAYHPHITLARWKGRRSHEVARFLDRSRGLSSPAFRTSEFVLFESRLSRHGAHYEEIATYPLV